MSDLAIRKAKAPFAPWPNPTSPPYWLRVGLPVLLVDGLRMETRTISGFTYTRESSIEQKFDAIEATYDTDVNGVVIVGR